jgi:hypothetical protein
MSWFKRGKPKGPSQDNGPKKKEGEMVFEEVADDENEGMVFEEVEASPAEKAVVEILNLKDRLEAEIKKINKEESELKQKVDAEDSDEADWDFDFDDEEDDANEEEIDIKSEKIGVLMLKLAKAEFDQSRLNEKNKTGKRGESDRLLEKWQKTQDALEDFRNNNIDKALETAQSIAGALSADDAAQMRRHQGQ